MTVAEFRELKKSQQWKGAKWEPRLSEEMKAPLSATEIRMDEHARWMDEHPEAWEQPEAPNRSRTYVYHCKSASMSDIYDAYNEYRESEMY